MIRYAGNCYLGWSTASLKFRQFNSAVCDALVGMLVHVLHFCVYGVGVGACKFTTYGRCVPNFRGVGLLFTGWCLLQL